MRKKGLVMTLCTLFLLLPLSGQTVYARVPPEITVISEIMFGSREGYRPEPVYEEGGQLYRLESWELESVTVKPRKKQVEQEVLYEGTESRDMIPEMRIIASEEEFSGLKVEDRYPILRIKKRKEEWREDFFFPVTFHAYGADEYELGSERISLSPGEPQLELYKEALLLEIGVTPENYEITRGVWEGAPYMNRNDVLCRDAVAYGKRKVADYLVTYGGTVTFPEVEGFKCRAVYRFKEFERNPAQEKAIVSGIVSQLPEDGADPSWIVSRKTVVFTVSLCLLLVILGAVVWLTKRTVDRLARRKDGKDGV